MPAGPYNYVTFSPDDDPDVLVALTLEDDFVISAGLQPNINRAIVPYTEYDKLEGHERRGTIKFWNQFTPFPDDGGDPFKPADVALQRFTIVQVEPSLRGRTTGPLGVWRTVEYRLFIADYRISFAEPRGGRLMHGEINPEPLTPGWTLDDLWSNGELISACLSRIDADFDPPPAAVDTLPPLRKLKWMGSHVANELGKVLEHVGAAYCPRMDAELPAVKSVIEMLGSTATPLPVIDEADRLPTTSLPLSDRRSNIVIITSAPTAVADSYDADAYAEPGYPLWHFVVPDADGKWWKIDDPAGPVGADALAEFRKGFPGVADPVLRENIKSLAYQAVQLDTTQFPSGKAQLLAKFLLPDGSTRAIFGRARVMTKDSAGLWSNPAAKGNVFPVSPKTESNVIIFGTLLGRLAGAVSGSTADPVPSFVPLEPGELEMTFTVEGWNAGAEMKLFFNAGFRREDDDSITRLLPEVVMGLLDGGGSDAIIIERPELRLHRINGDEVNRLELEDASELLVRQYLVDDESEHKVMAGRGFIPAVTSGRVAEIRYSQRDLLTTFRVNSWWAPSFAAGLKAGVFERDINEALPQQQRTEPDRQRLGEGGAARPAIVSESPTTTNHERWDCRIVLYDAETPPGHYKARLLPGDQEVYAININGEPSGKHYAPADNEFQTFAMLGEFNPDAAHGGRRTVRFSFDWRVHRAWRVHAHDGFNWFQGHPTPGYSGEEGWVDLLKARICP